MKQTTHTKTGGKKEEKKVVQPHYRIEIEAEALIATILAIGAAIMMVIYAIKHL